MEKRMPGWIRYMLERGYWTEIFATTAIILGGWAAARIFAFLVDRAKQRWALRTATTHDDYFFDAIRRPGSLILFLMGIYLALHRYTFPFLSVLDNVIFVICVVVVVHTLIKISSATLRWYSVRLARERQGDVLAGELLPMADKAVKLVILAVGLIVVLDHFRIDIKSILVTLGVGTLAIGLALQDTLANMFGGLTILLDRPFRVGDRIKLSTGEVGDVQDIGIRSTRVLSQEGNLLIIPNALLVKAMMTNFSFPDDRAIIVIDVGVAYGSDTEKAKQLMLEAAREHPQVLAAPAPTAAFKSFGDFALNLSLICFTSNFRTRLQVIDVLNSAIHTKFGAARISIPYPIRTVHLQEAERMTIDD